MSRCFGDLGFFWCAMNVSSTTSSTVTDSHDFLCLGCSEPLVACSRESSFHIGCLLGWGLTLTISSSIASRSSTWYIRNLALCGCFLSSLQNLSSTSSKLGFPFSKGILSDLHPSVVRVIELLKIAGSKS